ncbi:hypothetical protein Hanom_Chr12g01067551 [Helianthus anomalus]
MGYWILSPSTIGIWPLPPATNTLTLSTLNLTFCLHLHHSVKSALTWLVFYPRWHHFADVYMITWLMMCYISSLLTFITQKPQKSQSSISSIHPHKITVIHLFDSSPQANMIK